MTVDRELVLQLAARRAGFTETQLDALRRHDWGALLAERTAPEDVADPAAPDAADVLTARATGPREDPLEGSPLERDPLAADLARVSDRLAVVRRQRDAAVQVLRHLAARLGCCPHCWGTDAACPTCAGAGAPGHFPPDPDLAAWIAPALARVPTSAGDDGVAPPVPPRVPVPHDPAAASAARTDGWA